MKKSMRVLCATLVLILLVCAVSIPALAEEGEFTHLPEDPAEPTEPVADVTPEPVPDVTPPPVEDAGTVDLTIYAYDNGYPADGYTVTIDETRLTANADGKVLFPALTVEHHSISIADKNGNTSTGKLYLSRADNTGVNADSMGAYGITIARGATQLYFNAHYKKGAGIEINQLSDKAPSPLPRPSATTSPGESPSASASPGNGEVYEQKTAMMRFLDTDGDGVNGMEVVVEPEGGTRSELKTGNGGTIKVDALPYGATRLSFPEADAVTLHVQRGVQTALMGSDGDAYSLSIAPTAREVYLEFAEVNGRYVLRVVSETIPGDQGLMAFFILVAVILVIVIIVVVLVRKNAIKKREQNRKLREELSRDTVSRRPVEPRRTGGANKFDDRSHM